MTIRCRPLFSVALVLILPLCSVSAEDSRAPSEWRLLFNGKNLDGWQVKIAGYDLNDNFGETFRVEDGVLKVAYDQYEKFDDRFGHLFYETPFSRYVLRVEYRFVGEQVPGGAGWAWRNSGIMVHGQPPETMERNQSFPVSIEVQLLGGPETGERPTANLCTPGTHVVMGGTLFTPHCTSSRSKTYRGDQWVTVEVEVRGSERIRHIVEGETVLEYTQPQLDENDRHGRQLIKDGQKLLESGTISLQSESHPVEFRRIEIRQLTD
jgi:hypothetical protein